MVRIRIHPLFLALVLTLSLLQSACTHLRTDAQAPSILGRWDYTMNNPDRGTITGVMTIEEKGEGGYTGHVSAVEIGIDEVLIVDSLDFDGAAFTMQGWLTGMELVLKGTVDGDRITGTNEVIGMDTFTFEARRAGE